MLTLAASVISQFGNLVMKAIALSGVLLSAVGLHLAAASIFQFGESLTRRRCLGHLSNASDWWQFLQNRELKLAGRTHYDDPLLKVTVDRVKEGNQCDAGRTVVHGMLAPNGIRLLLLSTASLAEEAKLYVDDVPVASITVRRHRILAKNVSVARFTLRRGTVAMLPADCRLSIRGRGGGDAPSSGASSANLRINVPGGSGDLKKYPYPAVDKKGFPSAASHPQDNLAPAVGLYHEASRFFREQLGKELFLVYGTLLGPIREGRFLPWDDDFDVAYFSDHNSVEAVRDEAAEFMTALVMASFSVGVNKQGRPFRLGEPAGLGGVYLDVRPIWFMDGATWAPKHARLPLEPKHFTPCDAVQVGGERFLVPSQPEMFLEAYYGPSWREPRPGHREASMLRKEERKVFNRLKFSPPAIIAVNRSLAEGGSSAGEILSQGLTPLYPLEGRAKLMGI